MRIHTLFLGAVVSLGLMSSPALAGVELSSISQPWAQQALDSAAQLEATQPALAASIRTGDSRPSRNGQPLFIDPTWRTPEAAGAILVRLAEGGDNADHRIALLGALSHTGGDWADGVLGLYSHETDPSVRRMMIDIMADAPIEAARVGVKVGFDDRSPAVRAAAMRVVGTHREGNTIGELALSGLSDDSPVVREEAARSIGYAGYAKGFEAMRSLLQDADASVRFRALRSLEKLDMTRLQQLPELSSLAVDPNIKVAREAQKVQAK